MAVLHKRLNKLHLMIKRQVSEADKYAEKESLINQLINKIEKIKNKEQQHHISNPRDSSSHSTKANAQKNNSETYQIQLYSEIRKTFFSGQNRIHQPSTRKKKMAKVNIFQNLKDNLPKYLSKKSTNYSNNNSIKNEAFKKQNAPIRQQCLAESQKVVKMQNAISDERKMNRIRRQLYQQSIDKLQRISMIKMMDMKRLQEELDLYTKYQSISEYGELFDYLQIKSH